MRAAILTSLSLVIVTSPACAQGKPVGQEYVYRKAGEREMKLYVVFPKDRKPDERRPAIVFFHHGSWIVGGPTQFNEQCKYLASRGIVAIQVDYRLLDRNSKDPPIPCIEDARSSMRWVRANAAKLGVDPERIAAGGGSAGGHLAAFLGMMDGFDAPGDDLKISPRANAMILYDPAFDNGPGKWGHERVKERYKEFSPFYNVGPKMPPSVIIVGEKDGIVPPKRVEIFAQAMKDAGNRCEAVIYPGKPHDFHNWNPNKANPDFYDTLERVDRFLISLGWLQGEPTIKLDAVKKASLVVPLWPGKPADDVGVAGEERFFELMVKGKPHFVDGKPTKWLTNVTRPTLTIYRPAKELDTGAVMLIAPGGGYHNLGWDVEGEEIAAWCNSIGVTGIILKYRCPRRPEDVKGVPPIGPLKDAQRAISLVRSKAKEWNLDPKKIGMVGFSAGGHLVGATCTNFEKRAYEPIDAVDQISCRPDFGVLCYSGYFKVGDGLSPTVTTPKDAPPMFFVHATDDPISDAEHSVTFYLALKRAGTNTEMLLYESGGHGFGVRPGSPCFGWTRNCAEWMGRRGFLKGS